MDPVTIASGLFAAASILYRLIDENKNLPPKIKLLKQDVEVIELAIRNHRFPEGTAVGKILDVRSFTTKTLKHR